MYEIETAVLRQTVKHMYILEYKIRRSRDFQEDVCAIKL